MSDFVVVRNKPRRRFFWGLVTIFILLLLSLTAYELGRYGERNGWRSLWSTHQIDEISMTGLSIGNAQLREQLAALKRIAKIDNKSQELLQQDYHLLQEELLALREELSFYRGLVSPGEKKEGLYIERVKLTKSAKPRGYHLVLVLAHVTAKDKAVKGAATIFIDGQIAGTEKTVALREVTDPSIESWNFYFRSFPNITDELILPEDFQPISISVSLATGRKGSKPVEKIFPWTS